MSKSKPSYWCSECEISSDPCRKHSTSQPDPKSQELIQVIRRGLIPIQRYLQREHGAAHCLICGQPTGKDK